jgi:hypothetical protein
MKNESKITELLAESLRKQDQMIERQDKQEELLNKQEQLLNVLTQGQAQLLLAVKDLVDNQKETNKKTGEHRR